MTIRQNSRSDLRSVKKMTKIVRTSTGPTFGTSVVAEMVKEVRDFGWSPVQNE